MERSLDSSEDFNNDLKEINKLLNKTNETLLELDVKQEILEPSEEYRNVLHDFDYLKNPMVLEAKDWFKRFYYYLCLIAS